MHYLYAQLPKEEYLENMKQKFDSPFRLWDERITGFVLGRFFSVAHYQEHEWNRKVTSECNRAWGFVKETDGELEICFLRGKGLLAPEWLLLYTLLCRLIFLVAQIRDPMLDMGIYGWLLSAVCALIVGIVTAIQCCFTEKGQEGEGELIRFLLDPENYYC